MKPEPKGQPSVMAKVTTTSVTPQTVSPSVQPGVVSNVVRLNHQLAQTPVRPRASTTSPTKTPSAKAGNGRRAVWQPAEMPEFRVHNDCHYAIQFHYALPDDAWCVELSEATLTRATFAIGGDVVGVCAGRAGVWGVG